MGSPLSKSDAQLEEYSLITREFLDSILQSPVDFFPLLRIIPAGLQFWRGPWLLKRDHHKLVFRQWWDSGIAAMQHGRASFSFARDVLLPQKTQEVFSENEAM